MNANRPAVDASRDQVDPVTRYLRERGLQPQVAYLEESDFELGLRIVWDALDLTYRYEAGTLLLCEVTTPGSSKDVTGAIRRLASLIHAIERAVPEVARVKGLVPADGDGRDDGAAEQPAERLLSVYRRLGADCRPDACSPMTAVTYEMRRSHGAS